MVNSSQAKKRVRQNIKHRTRNMALRTKMRTFLKKVMVAIAGGNKDEAKTAYHAAQAVVDSMVSKGIIHKNKAARHKSRLNAQIKSMA